MISRKRLVRISTCCKYWSEANNVRARDIRKMQNDTVASIKVTKKGDSSFPDIRRRNLPNSTSTNWNPNKSIANFGHAFDSLHRKEYNAQRIQKIIGKKIIFIGDDNVLRFTVHV